MTSPTANGGCQPPAAVASVRDVLHVIGCRNLHAELKKMPSLRSRQASHFFAAGDVVAVQQELATAKTVAKAVRQALGDDDEEEDKAQKRKLAELASRVQVLTKERHGTAAMARVLRRGTAKLAELIRPGDPAKLLDEVGFDCNQGALEDQESAADKVVEMLATVLENAPRRSPQRRAVWAVLVKSLSRREGLGAQAPA
jgi:hypothetical protein